MAEEIETLHADIAFLRGLAEAGREAPSRAGGALIAAAGAIYAIACVVHWAFHSGRLAAPAAMDGWIFPTIWLGATAVFVASMRALRRRYGDRAPSRRPAAAAWAGVGWTIFALAGSIAVLSWRIDSDLPTLLFPSLILALYGLGWMVGAAASGRRWIWGVSIASYVMAVVVAWFSVAPEGMLVLAAALIALAFLPGLVLMRGAGVTAR